MSQAAFPFARLPKTSCMTLLNHWAAQRGVRVRSTASVRAPASAKRGPHSELCLHVRCAGKQIRAFAKSSHGMAAIAYMDKGGCHFTSGTKTEVLPPEFWRAAGEPGFSGARRKRRRR